jgi:hypothetical protein
MSEVTPIRRALVSVYDKTGLEDLARGLARHGVTIISTGSTAGRIRDAGVEVTEVAEVTGFPECLDGRVKTLHPRVHAGLLADRSKPSHLRQLEDLSIEAIDLVVVNLYPFQAAVASGASDDEIVEMIDIGGPTMLRAAAKNFAHVGIVVSPDDYANLLADLDTDGGLSAGPTPRTGDDRVRARRHLRRGHRQLVPARPGLPGPRPPCPAAPGRPAALRREPPPGRRRLRRRDGSGPRPGRGTAAARQADVVQQLHRHRRRVGDGRRLRRSVRGDHQAHQPGGAGGRRQPRGCLRQGPGGRPGVRVRGDRRVQSAHRRAHGGAHRAGLHRGGDRTGLRRGRAGRAAGQAEPADPAGGRGRRTRPGPHAAVDRRDAADPGRRRGRGTVRRLAGRVAGPARRRDAGGTCGLRGWRPSTSSPTRSC